MAKPQKTPLPELLAEYKTLPAQCANTNYADADSIKAHNKAVRRMQRLAERIAQSYDLEGAYALAELLEVTEDGTAEWAAQHLLENFDVDETIGERALAVMEKAAEGDSVEAMGRKAWLLGYMGGDQIDN